MSEIMWMRLLHAGYRILRPAARWARRRFTPAGAFVLVGMFLTGAASHPEQTMGLQVFVLLLAMLAAAFLMTPFFRVRCVLERRAPRFVTAGEPFLLRLRLRNLTSRLQRGLEYLEHIRDRPLTLPQFTAALRPGGARRRWLLSDPLTALRRTRTRPVALPPLPAGGVVEARAEAVAYRRGPLVFTGGWLARTDPMGLVRAFRHLANPQTVLVLPRRYPLPPMRLPGQSHYQRGGVALAAGVGESEEFVALRDYRRGDSLRRVHWRSAARQGRLVVKEFQDENFVRHALVLDTFCDPARDELFEEAVAVASSFACTVPDQESLLDLMLVGPQTVCVTSGRGVGHAQQMLEVLASVQPCRKPRWRELESLVLQHGAGLSGVILLLMDWDAPRRALVRRVKSLQVPIWVLLMVPPGPADLVESGPPEDQPDRLVRLETGRVREGLQQL